jgi:hypothetical protein
VLLLLLGIMDLKAAIKGLPGCCGLLLPPSFDQLPAENILVKVFLNPPL